MHPEKYALNGCISLDGLHCSCESTPLGHGEGVRALRVSRALDVALDRNARYVSSVMVFMRNMGILTTTSSGLALEAMITLVTPCYLPFFAVIWMSGRLDSSLLSNGQ